MEFAHPETDFDVFAFDGADGDEDAHIVAGLSAVLGPDGDFDDVGGGDAFLSFLAVQVHDGGDDDGFLMPTAVGRQQSTSSVVSLGNVFDDSADTWGLLLGDENAPPRPTPCIHHAAWQTSCHSTPPSAPVLVKLSKRVLIEDGPATAASASPTPATVPASWNSPLSAEAREKHKGWAKKRKRVRYGTSYVWEKKRAVAKKRARQDGKFETREMRMAQLKADAALEVETLPPAAN